MSAPVVKWSIYGHWPQQEEFDRETDKFVFKKGDWREVRTKKGQYIFDSFEEAKNAMLKRQEDSLAEKRNRVVLLEKQIPETELRCIELRALTEETLPQFIESKKAAMRAEMMALEKARKEQP